MAELRQRRHAPQHGIESIDETGGDFHALGRLLAAIISSPLQDPIARLCQTFIRSTWLFDNRYVASPRLTNAPIVPAVTSACPTDAPIDRGLVLRRYQEIGAADVRLDCGISVVVDDGGLNATGLGPLVDAAEHPHVDLAFGLAGEELHQGALHEARTLHTDSEPVFPLMG